MNLAMGEESPFHNVDLNRQAVKAKRQGQLEVDRRIDSH